MDFDKDFQLILDGNYGEALSKLAMLLLKEGESKNAKELIDVENVHISGVSYETTGGVHLDLLQDLIDKGIKAKVPTTINPGGMDLKEFKRMGISKDFAVKQLQIIEAYRKLGFETTNPTCTPYYGKTKPTYNSHIAWAESSAVIYANSVLGAKTNRESGLVAIAASLIGKVPYYGYHLDENRKPTRIYEVDTKLEDTDFGALGYFVGCRLEGYNQVPLFKLEKNDTNNVSEDNLKSLGAALAASGAISLFYVLGITPKPKPIQWIEQFSELKTEKITGNEIKAAYDDLQGVGGENTVDLVFMGCPQSSGNEIKFIANLIKGREVHSDVELWISTSRKNFEKYKKYAQVIELAGGKIICDTCCVVCPLERLKNKSIHTVVTNSAKSAVYLPDYRGVSTFFSSTEECVESAMAGVIKGKSAAMERTNYPKFSAHGVSGGRGLGHVMKSIHSISFLGGVDPKTGRIIDSSNEELFNKSITKNILVFPYSKGSTVGSYVLYQLSKSHKKPSGMLMLNSESITTSGAIIGGIPLIDGIGREQFNLIKQDDFIAMDGDLGVFFIVPKEDVIRGRTKLIQKGKELIGSLEKRIYVVMKEGSWLNEPGFMRDVREKLKEGGKAIIIAQKKNKITDELGKLEGVEIKINSNIEERLMIGDGKWVFLIEGNAHSEHGVVIQNREYASLLEKLIEPKITNR